METIEVNIKDKPCKVVMEELTFGEKNEALRKATVIDPVTQNQRADTVTFGEWRLVYSIKDMDLVGWKNATTEDAKMKIIRGLSMKVGNVLSSAEARINLGITEDDKKK